MPEPVGLSFAQLDVLLSAGLTGRQATVVFAVLWGLQRPIDIAEATGLRRENASRELKYLLEAKVLVPDKYGVIRVRADTLLLESAEDDRHTVSETTRFCAPPDDATPCDQDLSPPTLPMVPPFPLRDGSSWELPSAKKTEWKLTFPEQDVDVELASARQWLLDNPTKRKTARGMPAFLGGWLRRNLNGRRIEAGQAGPRAGAFERLVRATGTRLPSDPDDWQP